MNDRDRCPLCGAFRVREYCEDRRRAYLRCERCSLVFVPAAQLLSAEAEKKRYDLHQNASDDPGYRRFLERLFLPLKARLSPGCSGLDFGSGPEPALSMMFANAGHPMTIFDPIYHPHLAAFEARYAFITASEVLEHVREPSWELNRLWGCLDLGGILGIMTQPAKERNVFPEWHYKNDLTHIRFYSPQTFDWLARAWNAELSVVEPDIVLFRKRAW